MIPSSDNKQLVFLPQCPRPEPVAGYDDWYSLERNPSMLICPDCRHENFGSGWERAFRRAAEPKRGQKIHCSMNDPWVRLGCLDAFKRQRADTKVLDMLAEVTQEELPCPQAQLAEDRTWFHLRDDETGKDYKDFHVCAHCVCSLETIYPALGDIFVRSKKSKDKDKNKDNDPRVCSLRSDVNRFGKYLNYLITMAEETPKGVTPPTADFIWEIKWMTVISPCNGAAVHYGQDMHSHPDLPQFTICEECYYRVVRPLIKTVRAREPPYSTSASSNPTNTSNGSANSTHFIRGITPTAKEIVGASTCKLYSPRMRQIFETAVKERDWEYLAKAVKKRSELLEDLEEAKMALAKDPLAEKRKEEVEYLKGKWEKLERKHE